MRIALVAMTAAITLAFTPTLALAQTEDAPTTRTSEHDVERLLGSDVESVKERAQAAIERRLATIERLQARVAVHPHVTEPHQGEVLAELDRSAAGLRALSMEIDQATAVEELRVLVPKIAADFRICIVVAPKVHQVLGSDSVVAAGTRLEAVSDSVAAWIDLAAGKGVDVSVAVAHLADMTEEIRQAVAVGQPVVSAVLPLTGADWPNPAATLLTQGRSDLGEAHRFLLAARDSGREAVAALRAALGS